jgi:hypothetical protein
MVAALAFLLLVGGPGPFSLGNGTGATLESIAARTVGSRGEWQTLGPGRLSPGARGNVPAFGREECLHDIQAQSEGRRLRWADVNLCDVRSVTLNRRPDGTLWVDYD